MTTPRPTAPVDPRCRTTPLETAYAARSMLTYSRLPSPPDDDMDASSDDTITASGKKSTNGVKMQTIMESKLQAHISSTSTWADLPILITFVSPAIALLAGGDYLQAVSLTGFLAWYLHQLVKVPWDIYLASPPPPSFAPTHRRRRPRPAFTHLRTTRLLALLLSALAPFLGAWLLKLGTNLLSSDALSWFSMSLFVLAAGVRPWRHLTHLLLTRTDALHLAAHRPSHLRPAFLARLAAPHGEREREREREREMDRARIETLENELAVLKNEMSALSARARAMARTVKGVDRRAGTIEGRVEVLERHGNGLGQSGGVGVWDGLGMIAAGVINIIHGMLCVVFPFMAGPSRGVGSKVGSEGKKKAKKLRRVVNNLPPVPEADESVADGRPTSLDANAVHLDGMGRDVRSPETMIGVLGGAVDTVTWPMRAMRGVTMGYVKAVAGR